MIKIKTTNLVSTSGLLCLSTSCDGKFLKHKDAFNVCLIQSKYGLRVLAYKSIQY